MATSKKEVKCINALFSPSLIRKVFPAYKFDTLFRAVNAVQNIINAIIFAVYACNAHNLSNELN